MNFDHRTLGEAFSYPGIDPRMWVSFATVDDDVDGDDGKAIQFDEEDGQVYVNVTLKPSLVPARARLGMLCSGNGEGAYFPLMPGDEVLAVLPEGDPRAGVVVVARLANFYDPIPRESVGGKDPTLNALAFVRTRAALTIESGATIMLRSATAGAFLQLDAKGGITLRDGAKGVLQMNADVLGYQNEDTSVIFQLDLNEPRLNVQVGDAAMILCGNGSSDTPQSYLAAPSSFAIATGGLSINSAVEHATSTEAVANVLVALGALVGVPWPPASVAAALTIAATAPLDPSVSAAIQAAFAVPVLKPPGVPGIGQAAPGIGSAGFLLG